MAEYSAYFSDAAPLEFGVEEIRDLIKAARDYLGAGPKITIEFGGDHRISSDDLDQLLSDPYVRSLRINALKIDGSRYDDKEYRACTIDIEPHAFVGVVRINLRGERDSAVTARDTLERTLRGCLLWYWPLYRPYGPGFMTFRLIVTSLVMFSVIFAVYSIFRGIPVSKDVLTQAGEAALWMPLALQLVVALRARLFPRLLFSFGKSAEVAKTAAYWRNTVFVGILLAVATGIIATLITDHFK